MIGSKIIDTLDIAAYKVESAADPDAAREAAAAALRAVATKLAADQPTAARELAAAAEAEFLGARLDAARVSQVASALLALNLFVLADGVERLAFALERTGGCLPDTTASSERLLAEQRFDTALDEVRRRMT